MTLTSPTTNITQLKLLTGKGAAEVRISLISHPRPIPFTHSSQLSPSLACDQCRKTKSKCERFKGDDEPCKSCLAAGTCTSILLFPILSLSFPRLLNSPSSTSLHLFGYAPYAVPPPTHPNHSVVQARASSVALRKVTSTPLSSDGIRWNRS